MSSTKGESSTPTCLSQQVELGRLRGDEPKDRLFAKQPVGNGFRVAIVEPSEASVSRQHVLVQRISDNRIKITNITTTNFVRVGNDNIVAGESRELNVPAQFLVGTAEIRVGEEPELQSLAGTDTLPGEAIQMSEKPLAAALLKLPDEQAEPVIEWLDSIVKVLQSAASSSDFYQHATQALVKLVGLDSGRVLMRKGNRWEQKSHEIAPFATEEDCDAAPSSHILGSLLREKRTVWSDPENSAFDMQQSLVGVQAVVAAPIFDRHGEVIGALYGDRHFRTRSLTQAGLPQISRAEAMLVKILAASVATGLARVEQEQAAKDQEQAAVAARALFGQFFTPELSDKLASDPHMLSGRDTEVTLLFCDIRDFSGISQRLDPSVTMDWIGDVIGVLSDCVINHQGVLVDYVGDELLAMWGAPSEQADQALLACRAAVAMQDALPTLNQRWQSRMGKPFRIGVGINTGTARVGNIGSHRKMKYGPLGNTVNMASRVQGMTKVLEVRDLDYRRDSRATELRVHDPPALPGAGREYFDARGIVRVAAAGREHLEDAATTLRRSARRIREAELSQRRGRAQPADLPISRRRSLADPAFPGRGAFDLGRRIQSVLGSNLGAAGKIARRAAADGSGNRLIFRGESPRAADRASDR